MRIATRKLLRTISAIFFLKEQKNVLQVALKGLKNKQETGLLSSYKPNRHHKNTISFPGIFTSLIGVNVSLAELYDVM